MSPCELIEKAVGRLSAVPIANKLSETHRQGLRPMSELQRENPDPNLPEYGLKLEGARLYETAGANYR
jgi:hypothetical protein